MARSPTIAAVEYMHNNTHTHTCTRNNGLGMQASHINAQEGSLLLILGTTMQFGYGPVQTLCTARARHTHSAQYAPVTALAECTQTPRLKAPRKGRHLLSAAADRCGCTVAHHQRSAKAKAFMIIVQEQRGASEQSQPLTL